MIDHLLGRPSPSWKRIQVFLVSLTWFFFLFKIDRRGPKFLHIWNEKLSRFSPFQLVSGTLAVLYILKNADRMIGLGAPEPLARLYSRSYYRATWVLTALDAGFWTAMPIRPKPIRDIMCILFSIYYLIFADQADEKTRRIRATITAEHLRTSWEKTLNPYLRALIRLTHPHVTIHQKKIMIPRPENSQYCSRMVTGYIYYDGPLESFKYSDTLILNFPGGGFIAMPPPCHEDYLAQWAKTTQVPILSIDYGKAPEYPYPYALEECFDVYRSVIESNGEVIGMAGWKDKDGNQRKQIKIVLIGDSAGGNLVVSVMFKILESQMPIPHPNGLILIYPCLNFDITCWMPPTQLSVIRAESSTSIPGVLESKDHLSHKSPLSVVPDVKRKRWRKSFSRSTDDERTIEERVQVIEGHNVTGPNEKRLRPVIGTRLTMTSRMSFFNDRIINADLMRALAILYIGPNNYPDFSRDYFLSPIVGPEALLAQFPKTYLMCGEKDPLVDDTVVFAGLIREAKRKKKQLGNSGRFGEGLRISNLNNGTVTTEDSEDWVEVKIIQGASHAFLQMPSLLPENKGAISVCALWLHECCQNKLSNDINTNCTELIHEDEGLTFTSRHSKNSGIANFKENENGDLVFQEPDQVQDSATINDLHVSQLVPNILPQSNDNIQKSTSTTVLVPGHELWEQENILNENEILKRRRDTLVRNLAEGCGTTTTLEQSISEKVTK